MLLLAALSVALSGGGSLELSRRTDPDSGSAHEYVVKRRADGRIDPEFHELACSWDGTPAPCYPVALSGGGFLIVDCYADDDEHEGGRCALARYRGNGEVDSSFKTPFKSLDEESWFADKPTPEIVSITEVAVEKDGSLRVEGIFRGLGAGKDKTVSRTVRLSAAGALLK